MDSFEIRELRKEDEQIIAAIVERNATRWHVTPQSFRETYILPAFGDGFPYMFAAFHKGRHVGEIFLVIEEDGYCGIKNQAWITALHVAPEFRSQGIGRALVQVAKEKCLEHGLSALYLDTASSANYYDKLGGWEHIGKAWWKEGNQPVVVMKCELSAPD